MHGYARTGAEIVRAIDRNPGLDPLEIFNQHAAIHCQITNHRDRFLPLMTYTPEFVEREYNARLAIPEHPEVFRRWAERGSRTREQLASKAKAHRNGNPLRNLFRNALH